MRVLISVSSDIMKSGEQEFSRPYRLMESNNITADPVSVHDLHATLLHLTGIDHKRFTYRFEGRDYRLTDISGELVKPLIA